MDEVKRKAFLGRLSKALGREAIPESVEPFDYSKGPQQSMYQNLSHEEIVAMFKAEAERVGTKFLDATPETVASVLMEEIEARGGGLVVYPKQAEIETYGIDKAMAQHSGESTQFYCWDGSLGREANIGTAQDAAIGVSFPILGIAETATVIQPSDDECGRAVSLLPLCHIAILRTSTICPRMTQTMDLLDKAYKEAPEAFPSNIVHISGPSNTADIELVRVVGVHGPINVTFILVND